MEIKKYPEDFQVDEVIDIKNGKYLVFKVKTNRDTIDVIHEISKKTGIPLENLDLRDLRIDMQLPPSIFPLINIIGIY